ncbi:MAG: GNAT family N-acetyltransferase [Rickettsiales bacterium]|nr:GNAT family N-acetyltransferase [Rickettsiales bacterium]MCA0254029.1 GNAT family N-acetyltransferase [Pseudomonadota bacterium]
MNIRLLKSQDTHVLEEYLAPHKVECMFICSNLKAAGILYKGVDFEGEYFGYFDKHDDHLEQLLGVIVHYWNGNVMMHAEGHEVLEQLILHLKKNISRPVAGILGPNIQTEHVIKKLGLSESSFSINSNEGLYEINLEALNELSMPTAMNVVSAQDVPKNILIEWMKSYDIEALGALNDENLEKQVQEHWNLRLQKNDSWVLLLDGTPVALNAFNARLADAVQVGPVWTPPEYRNKGFARLLLAYTLHQEKLKGTKQAILFTDNPAAIKAYLAIGFKKIGNYRLALLEKPIQLQEIEFTISQIATDIDFLTQKINQETPEFGEAHPFVFSIRDEKSKIIAGCNGSVIFGSIYTDQLWVHPDYRKNGLGHKLMNSVHDYGRKSGCSMATACTMSFQGAKSFYEKLGYVSDFERPGYTQNSSCYFMRKWL